MVIPPATTPAPVTAPVTAPLTGRQWLARATKAMGALDRKDDIRLTLKGEVQTLWPAENRQTAELQQRGERRLYTYHQGSIERRVCVNGLASWMQAYGAVLTLWPFHRSGYEEEQRHSLSEAADWLAASSHVERMDVRKLPDGRPAQVVRITPPDEDWTEVYLDPSSGSVLATAWRGWSEQLDREVTFLKRVENLAVVYGTPVALHEDRFEDGRLMESTRWSRVDILSPVPARLFRRPLPPWKPVRRTTVPFDFSMNEVIVTASIDDGPPLRFMVDTGAAFTVVSQQAADELSLVGEGEGEAMGIGGGASLSFTHASQIRIGRTTAYDVPIAIADLSLLSGAMGRNFGGVLGFSVLCRYRATFDYRHRRLTLAPSVGRLRGSMPVDLDAGVIATTGEAGSEPFVTMIDTGSQFTAFSSRLKLSARKSVATAGFGADGRIVQMRFTRLRRLEVAGRPILDPVVALTNSESGASTLLSARRMVVLGNNVLRRYRLVIDYPGERLRLRPDPAGDPYPDDWTQPGLRLIGGPGVSARVFEVWHNSPAERAGIEVGQPVLAIDGRPTEDQESQTLDRWLQGPPGSIVRVTLKIDGEPRTFRLRRVRIL